MSTDLNGPIIPGLNDPLPSHPPAPFMYRVAATLIDSVIVGILNQLCVALVKKFLDPTTAQSIAYPTGLVITFFLILKPLAESGQSPGKKIMGIRLDSEEHPGPPTLGLVILREIPGKLLSGLILGIGYLMALGESKKALHDRMCKTRVVKI